MSTGSTKYSDALSRTEIDSMMNCLQQKEGIDLIREKVDEHVLQKLDIDKTENPNFLVRLLNQNNTRKIENSEIYNLKEAIRNTHLVARRHVKRIREKAKSAGVDLRNDCDTTGIFECFIEKGVLLKDEEELFHNYINCSTFGMMAAAHISRGKIDEHFSRDPGGSIDKLIAKKLVGMQIGRHRSTYAKLLSWNMIQAALGALKIDPLRKWIFEQLVKNYGDNLEAVNDLFEISSREGTSRFMYNLFRRPAITKAFMKEMMDNPEVITNSKLHDIDALFKNITDEQANFIINEADCKLHLFDSVDVERLSVVAKALVIDEDAIKALVQTYNNLNGINPPPDLKSIEDVVRHYKGLSTKTDEINMAFSFLCEQFDVTNLTIEEKKKFLNTHVDKNIIDNMLNRQSITTEHAHDDVKTKISRSIASYMMYTYAPTHEVDDLPTYAFTSQQDRVNFTTGDGLNRLDFLKNLYYKKNANGFVIGIKNRNLEITIPDEFLNQDHIKKTLNNILDIVNQACNCPPQDDIIARINKGIQAINSQPGGQVFLKGIGSCIKHLSKSVFQYVKKPFSGGSVGSGEEEEVPGADMISTMWVLHAWLFLFSRAWQSIPRTPDLTANANGGAKTPTVTPPGTPPLSPPRTPPLSPKHRPPRGNPPEKRPQTTGQSEIKCATVTISDYKDCTFIMNDVYFDSLADAIPPSAARAMLETDEIMRALSCFISGCPDASGAQADPVPDPEQKGGSSGSSALSRASGVLGLGLMTVFMSILPR